MIKVSHLNYEYPGKRALRDVSFSVPEGSVMALVGPNGAGKTTLLRCLAALDEPFSGAIEVAGIDVTIEPRRVHEVLGYLSDFFGLYDDLTVKQCLLFSAWLHRLAEDEVERQVGKTAEMLHLTSYLNKKVKTLSRGWRQRLGIAQAIIHKPRLLLLDEPAAGLDPEARIEVSKLFRELQRQGMTLVVSSHILAELEDYCTDMLVLRDGQVVESRMASNAMEKTSGIRIVFARDAADYMPVLTAIAGVSMPELVGQTIRFRFSGDEAAQQKIITALIEKGASIKGFDSGPEKLQDIYMSLGKKGEPGDAH